MRMGEGSQRVVIDWRVSLDVEAEGVAGAERAVWILSFDGLGQFGIVEGDGRVVPAVGRNPGDRHVVELEVIDLLQVALAGRLQSDELDARNVRAVGGVLQQGDEFRRLPGK